jgi:hypothetical protein
MGVWGHVKAFVRERREVQAAMNRGDVFMVLRCFLRALYVPLLTSRCVWKMMVIILCESVA